MDNNQNLLTNFNNKEKIKTNNSQFTQKRKIETNRRTALFFFGKIPIDSKPTHTSLHFNLSHQILLEMKMKITGISCQHEKVT